MKYTFLTFIVLTMAGCNEGKITATAPTDSATVSATTRKSTSETALMLSKPRSIRTKIEKTSTSRRTFASGSWTPKCPSMLRT